MINRVILVGHLGKDPECKQTSEGRAMVTFSLATKERSRDGSMRTDWHQVVAFDKTAEILTMLATPSGDRYASLRKGSLVYVEGSIRTDITEDKKSGGKKYFTRIYATRATLLGSVGPRAGSHPNDSDYGGYGE